MKIIGLLGGMSWESSLHYYRLLNEGVRDRLGGLSSAPCLLYSVDFAPIARMQAEGRWDEAAEVLSAAARSLELAGAEVLVLCTNTMHMVADALERSVRVPLLHIADVCAAEVSRKGIRRVGLLGTRFTMEQRFYTGRLAERHGIEVLTPNLEQRESIHRVIYEELCRGVVKPESRAAFVDIVADLQQRGAEGVMLACTEIMLLIAASDVTLPVFDTTAIHAAAAVEFALAASD